MVGASIIWKFVYDYRPTGRNQIGLAMENARLFGELNRSYAHLHRAQDELIRSEKLRALGQMSAGVAHDLNNTLGAILSQVELLQSYKTDATLRERRRGAARTRVQNRHVLVQLAHIFLGLGRRAAEQGNGRKQSHRNKDFAHRSPP